MEFRTRDGGTQLRRFASALSAPVFWAAAVWLLGQHPDAALAQSATPGSFITLAPITVEGEALTQESIARERLEATPGGTGIIVGADLEGKANLTISDVLATSPAIIVQDFFGGNDQPRVQMRGSGLQQNPVERGVLVLQNGLPINRADGSYIVGLTDARQAVVTEVFRGYTANRLGATVLGGAINFISPTGFSAPGVRVGAEGGSFGQVNSSLQAGFADATLDGLVQVSHSRRSGFREYNESNRSGVDGNVGFELTPDLNVRLFAGFTDLGFDVAGPLTRPLLEADPESVHPGPTVAPRPGMPPMVSNPGPNVVRDRPRRESAQLRLGSRATAAFGSSLFDVALGYTHTDDVFRFPIPGGVRSTTGGDINTVFRYAYRPRDALPLPLFEGTLNYVVGAADRKYRLNDAGTAGALFGRNDLNASTLSISAGFNVPIGEGFTLSPAVAWARATRNNDDTYDLPTRPTIAFNPANQFQPLPDGAVAARDTSYTRTYAGFTPSLGLSFRPHQGHLFFGAVSRSFEPPTHDDLIATVNGRPFSSAGRPMPGNPRFASAAFSTPDLDAQTATTVEAGWRGQARRAAWDIVGYCSRIDNELLSLRDESGAPLGAVNAGGTTHCGVELGLEAALSDRAGGRIAYTYQDFRFDDDPVRGDNRLAGAPRHTINAMVEYDVTAALKIQAEAQWSPEKTPVDNMNTLFNDPFVVIDARATYDLNGRYSIYGEARNIFDETYASSTLIVDLARPDQAAFLPGDGRALYAGLRARF